MSCKEKKKEMISAGHIAMKGGCPFLLFSSKGALVGAWGLEELLPAVTLNSFRTMQNQPVALF